MDATDPQVDGGRHRDVDYTALTDFVRRRGLALGFQQVAITRCDLGTDEAALLAWLDAGYHGELGYMARHGARRARPAELVPGTIRVVTVRMNYLRGGAHPDAVLGNPELGYISRYALGRDYHKVVRRRLQGLAEQIESEVGAFGYRAFADSAPVMEKPLARNAGLGWIGKHTNLINRSAGSWFFLGELYTDLPLEVDTPARDHCGTCRACIDACPTGAIVAPYRLDARRCISYLTIELHGPIPVEPSPAHRQPHLRMRRLSARMPLEQVRARERGIRLRPSTRAGLRGSRRAVRLVQAELRETHRGDGASPARI